MPFGLLLIVTVFFGGRWNFRGWVQVEKVGHGVNLEIYDLLLIHDFSLLSVSYRCAEAPSP